MKAGVIAQARMGSTRFPGKVLMSIDKKNLMLDYVVNQLRCCKFVDEIVIATTNLKEDDKIVDYSKKIGVDCFRGSSDDVLDRYYKCAKKFSFSTIVRITCDCPLIDPNIVDKVIKKFHLETYDYVTNKLPRILPTYPQGTEVEVFSLHSFERVWLESELPSEREHVTPYFYNNPEKFKIFSLTSPSILSYLRWTVDSKEDLEFVRKIVSKINKRPILMRDILNILAEEPDLIKINSNHVLNEGYLKSLKKDEEFLKFKD